MSCFPYNYPFLYLGLLIKPINELVSWHWSLNITFTSIKRTTDPDTIWSCLCNAVSGLRHKTTWWDQSDIHGKYVNSASNILQVWKYFGHTISKYWTRFSKQKFVDANVWMLYTKKCPLVYIMLPRTRSKMFHTFTTRIHIKTSPYILTSRARLFCFQNFTNFLVISYMLILTHNLWSPGSNTWTLHLLLET